MQDGYAAVDEDEFQAGFVNSVRCSLQTTTHCISSEIILTGALP